MTPKLRPILLLSACICIGTGCKKNTPPKPVVYPSDKKVINAFTISTTQNPQLPNSLFGNIVGDSIFITASDTVSLTNCIPIIDFAGARISPDPAKAQNFNRPVMYTVTADDSTSRSYFVVSRFLSHAKGIISFGFNSADNPGLATNLKGV